jgi:hypothetical protein
MQPPQYVQQPQYMQPPMQQQYMQLPMQSQYMQPPMQSQYMQPFSYESGSYHDPTHHETTHETKITIKNQKKNKKVGVWLPVIIAVVIIIIVCCLLFSSSDVGEFAPMTKCTTCNEHKTANMPASLTCQSATAKGTKCNWCRPPKEGYDVNAALCNYGVGSKKATGKWVPRAWNIHAKNHKTKKHAKYTTVNAYKIFSINHPPNTASKAICVTMNAKCKNCTHANPINEVCKNHYQ